MTLSVRRAAEGAGHQIGDRHVGRAWVVALLVAAVLAVGVIVSCLSVVFTRDSESNSGYTWYEQMMGGYGTGVMMGGEIPGWVTSPSGYRWMMGGASAPGWMRGGSLPSPMMGGSTDPGRVMGRLFADSPGPRVSSATSGALGNRVPAGAAVNRSANSVVFSTRSIKLTVVASPRGNPDETFRIAGLVNPTVVVPVGSRVTLQLVNADADTAHGLVITAGPGTSTWMPMMRTRPAFGHSSIWFLGDRTSAGLHTATTTFTASTGGNYRYLCPVPGHEQKGMWGRFVVSG